MMIQLMIKQNETKQKVLHVSRLAFLNTCKNSHLSCFSCLLDLEIFIWSRYVNWGDTGFKFPGGTWTFEGVCMFSSYVHGFLPQSQDMHLENRWSGYFKWTFNCECVWMAVCPVMRWWLVRGSPWLKEAGKGLVISLGQHKKDVQKEKKVCWTVNKHNIWGKEH